MVLGWLMVPWQLMIFASSLIAMLCVQWLSYSSSYDDVIPRSSSFTLFLVTSWFYALFAFVGLSVFVNHFPSPNHSVLRVSKINLYWSEYFWLVYAISVLDFNSVPLLFFSWPRVNNIVVIFPLFSHPKSSPPPQNCVPQFVREKTTCENKTGRPEEKHSLQWPGR